MLISALGDLRTPESIGLLHKMQTKIPTNMPEAARELEGAIAWIASHPKV
jgi:hypothetical protein